MIRSPETSRGKLKKILGLSFGIAIAVGGTIGVGILRTPGNIAALLPDYSLIMLCWITGGLFMMITAISYAELAAMLPKAGGSYNYVKRAFGNYPGFLIGWFDYIVNTIAPAYFCIVISEYFILLFPEISEYKNLIAVSFLVFFTVIHLPGVKTGSLLQQISSLIKVLIFIILIAACFLHQGTVEPEKAVTITSKAGILLSFFMALQLIMGSYDGWWSVSFFAEEDVNPGKNIPRSLFIGTTIILLVYILINAAFFYVVPVSEAAASTLVASNAANIIFGRSGSVIITVFALLSLLSILNAYIMIPSRILFGLSRDTFFFPGFAFVNKGGTAVYALLFSFFLQLVLVLVSSFEQLFGLGAYLSLIVLGLAIASLIRLRIKEPDLPRPYRAWGYPYTTLISIAVVIAILAGFTLTDQESILVMAIIVLISIPCFYLLRRNMERFPTK